MQNIVRLMGWAYALLFVGVTALGYVPPFHDQQGYLFGLFKLEWWDDALHLGSGIWAAVAAWKSYEATRTYFRIFGPLYMFDGVCGLLTGMGYLDLGIFLHGPMALPLETRIGANLPHIAIGGIATIVGYVLARRSAQPATA
ncbi:MAG TPA: DUF4383 domain-containing protein [Sphingomicrobium sp.]|nr:DUF4383 domain-containing protein [Sphingomicrobium sp.]